MRWNDIKVSKDISEYDSVVEAANKKKVKQKIIILEMKKFR